MSTHAATSMVKSVQPSKSSACYNPAPVDSRLLPASGMKLAAIMRTRWTSMTGLSTDDYLACRVCGQVHVAEAIQPGAVAHCVRCGSRIQRRTYGSLHMTA